MRAEGILHLAARSRAVPCLTPEMLPGTCFRPGPLRNLPSQTYLSALLSTGDAHALGVALLMVVRDAFDPSALADIPMRRHWNVMRDAVLPRDAMRQRALLERFESGEAKSLSETLGLLITRLADHPQRQALQGFASQLFVRDASSAKAICRNPLVAAMLAGLGLFPDRRPPTLPTLQ